MVPLAGAFGGLLASAILTLEDFGGLTTWRMIFAIEGIVTIILAPRIFHHHGRSARDGSVAHFRRESIR